jgi:hypothetical protein
MNKLSLHQRPDQTASGRQQPAPCSASLRVKTCERMVRSPARGVPQVRIAAAASLVAAMPRTKRLASRAASVCMFIGMVTPAAFADQIVPTYLAPKVEAVTAAQLTPANSSIIPTFGTENFDGRATGASSGFTTNFNTGGAASANLGANITGTFGGGFSISSAGQYGAAGGTGNYIVAFASGGIDLTLSHTAALPGVNHFGLQISALDAGNRLTFYRAGVQVGQYGPSDLIQQVGACPNSSNPYCGNPTTGQDSGEQFAYVNFFDLSGYFDEVKLTQVGGGGFESDNYTVGYIDTGSMLQTAAVSDLASAVPEPSSTGPLLSVLAALLGFAAWQRRRRQAAAPLG